MAGKSSKLGDEQIVHLSAILTSGSNFGSWRLPEIPERSTLDFNMYRKLTVAAEQAKLDMIFFADSLAVNGLGGKVLEGVAVGSLEPITLIAALAAATSRIGLAATLSTSYSEPYQIARKFATIERLSAGRSAWNVVTSLGATEAYNFGEELPLDHALRYERADAFIEVVRQLWEQAITANCPGNSAAQLGEKLGGNPFQAHQQQQQQPAGSRSWFAEPGALNVSSGQKQPIVIQAGGSATFQEQAAKTAEVIFTAFRNLKDAQAFYSTVKGRMPHYGRTANQLKILPGIQPIIALTEKEAKEKEQYVHETLLPSTAISLLSARLGYDLSGHDPDGPLPQLPEPGPDVPSDTISSRRHIEGVAQADNLSIAGLARRMAGARGHLTFTGTPAQFADLAEEWVGEKGCDGFNLMSSYLPGGLLEFFELAVPELQERGLFRSDYKGNTLREHLGLE